MIEENDEVIAIIVDAVNEADDDVKEQFEEEVNIFEDEAYNDYIAAGSNIDTEDRRVIVAAAATATVAAAAARPTAPPPPAPKPPPPMPVGAPIAVALAPQKMERAWQTRSAAHGVGERNMEASHATSQADTTSVTCLLYTSPSPRDATLSRMPSSA